MHWLRIDDYLDRRQAAASQPVPCMHCEHAPCEPVCPVAASVHDSEGLNLQVYNRCVGTRFCQSNCPYKVRRFNFFGYADGEEYKSFGDEIVKAVFNPDVTVRGRGVMEKCTYCVQRISARAPRRREGTPHHPRRRSRHRLSGGLPDARHQLRRPVRSAFARQRVARRAAGLRAARQSRHTPAHDLSRAAAKSQSRLRESRVMSTAAIRTNVPPDPDRWTLPCARSFEAVNEHCHARRSMQRERWSWRAWWIGFAVSGALTIVLAGLRSSWCSSRASASGASTPPSVWGFAIANYVWWIGIGNAGTLISSMLLLMRQKWRASTNRFAEAMTLFAATIAGIFPIMHLGRPMYFYWLTPYPNTMTVWPQWRSALIWDFWAILSYILFSIIFWYVGLIPDLGHAARPRAQPNSRRHLRCVRARLARLGAALARL